MEREGKEELESDRGREKKRSEREEGRNEGKKN